MAVTIGFTLGKERSARWLSCVQSGRGGGVAPLFPCCTFMTCPPNLRRPARPSSHLVPQSGACRLAAAAAALAPPVPARSSTYRPPPPSSGSPASPSGESAVRLRWPQSLETRRARAHREDARRQTSHIDRHVISPVFPSALETEKCIRDVWLQGLGQPERLPNHMPRLFDRAGRFKNARCAISIQ
jgi:hypothetical protein